MDSLTESKDSLSDRDGVLGMAREEKVFEMHWTTLFYSQAPGRCQQNPGSKRVNRTSTVRQASHFWRKKPFFHETIENIYYRALKELNTTPPPSTNLLYKIPGIYKISACTR